VNEEDDYPDSEVDNMDWNDLEHSPLRGAITENTLKDQKIQLEEVPLPLWNPSQHIQKETKKEENRHQTTV